MEMIREHKLENRNENPLLFYLMLLFVIIANVVIAKQQIFQWDVVTFEHNFVLILDRSP